MKFILLAPNIDFVKRNNTRGQFIMFALFLRDYLFCMYYYNIQWRRLEGEWTFLALSVDAETEEVIFGRNDRFAKRELQVRFNIIHST
jgi:hypothetical protein